MAKTNSIRDIARHAGVSVASVSNVLNGKLEKVSSETADRIRAIVKELDYQPNLSARTLSSGRSKLIGLVFPVTVINEKVISLIGENPFYGEFYDGVEVVMNERGYDIIIAGIRPEEDCSDWVRRRGLDGVIFLGGYDRAMLERMEADGISVVLADTEPVLADEFPSVGIDDREGARLAVRHLIGLGHRRIALAGSGYENSFINRQRRDGYLDGLAEAGLKADPKLMFEHSVSFGGGAKAADDLLALSPRPTAVFAFADSMALGIYNTVLSRGLRVPQDLSIVGFDDLAIFRHLYPGLTTIRQDAAAKGSAAAKQLARRLAGESDLERKTVLGVELVVRGSTSSPS